MIKKSILGLITTCLLICCQSDKKLVSGKVIYKKYCVSCHGIKGDLLTNGALDLSRTGINLESRIEIIRNGRGNMTGFVEVLSSDQIDSVAQFTMSLRTEKVE